ncbi:YhcN/YlaJ family sporulation lipoprotein [Rummeliibacillus stabekisii]|uniref:Sporulation protein n=1 Tax=Rummeliibacillus stabekisii TaxID=241244 RepID=A0A143H921_9BACL|nr:YhcN/YlaJ family sporulation lipoprotein [Rummeliibacillus stabekisii]AMW98218.1 hypothetical protein ATY39_01570 [Rummeliibacillus stabekisii]
MKKSLLMFIALLTVLAGCGKSNSAAISVNDDHKYQEERQSVEKVLGHDKHVQKVSVLFTKKEAIVGVEVKPFSKWNKKKYEKKWKKEIKRALPNRNVLVSTDQKIIMETDRLNEKKMSEKKVKEKIKNLKELAEEQT